MMFMVVRTLSTPPKLQPVYPKGPGVQSAGTWCFGNSNCSASSGEYMSIGQNYLHPAMDADRGGGGCRFSMLLSLHRVWRQSAPRLKI